MTALPLEPHTEAEEATLARFEGAEPAEESAVEKVAQAMWEADCGPRSYSWDDMSETAHQKWRRLAVAALAAVRPSPDSEAVARVGALIDPAAGMAWPLHGERVFREKDIRAALSPAEVPQ